MSRARGGHYLRRVAHEGVRTSVDGCDPFPLGLCVFPSRLLGKFRRVDRQCRRVDIPAFFLGEFD